MLPGREREMLEKPRACAIKAKGSSVFEIPKSIIKLLHCDGLQRAFKAKFAKVTECLPRRQNGVGLRAPNLRPLVPSVGKQLKGINGEACLPSVDISPCRSRGGLSCPSKKCPMMCLRHCILLHPLPVRLASISEGKISGPLHCLVGMGQECNALQHFQILLQATEELNKIIPWCEVLQKTIRVAWAMLDTARNAENCGLKLFVMFCMHELSDHGES